MGCLIPVAEMAGEDAGADAGSGGGGGSSGSGGGTAQPFDGGTGYCGGLVDGGWRLTWAGKRNPSTSIPDGGSITYAQGLNGVWGSGPADVWAVGAETESGEVRGLIVHWDGSSWTPTPTTNLLHAVWGAGPNDVWAVGAEGTIVHWNGSAWSPSPSGTSRHLYDVWGTGPNNVWAVGGSARQPPDGTLILHWNGAVWSRAAAPDLEYLDGIGGTGPNDVWAVGYTGTVLHFDGASWASKSQGAPPVPLLGVFALSTTDVWVSAGWGTLVHWDGAQWSAGPHQTDGHMTSVWGHESNDLWSSDSTNCMRWDGVSWKRSPWGVPSNNEGRAFWGSGPQDIWAVGSHIFHYP